MTASSTPLSSHVSPSTINSSISGAVWLNLPKGPQKTLQRQLQVVRDLQEARNRKAEGKKVEAEKALEFMAKTMLLVAELFSDVAMPSPPLVQEIGFGSFNKVFSITIKQPLSHDNSGNSLTKAMAGLFRTPPKPLEYALRVPLNISTPMEAARNIASLKVVSSRATFPVPKILSYDQSVDNVLGSPYVLQQRLQGDNLAKAWDTLNAEQQASLVPQLTKLIEQIAAITSPAAGEVSAENLTFPIDKVIELTQFPLPPNSATASRQKYTSAMGIPAPNQTPLEYLLDHCQRWYDYDYAAGVTRKLTIWSQFQVIARSLDRLGFLGDRFHLSHEDLFARNIMVTVKNSNTAEITGIIDWDMCIFAPKFVALAPPCWAWHELTSYRWSVNSDPELNPNGYHVMLRDSYKKLMSPEFLRFATSYECVLANEMFAALLGGAQVPEQQVKAALLIREWREMHPEDIAELDKC